MPMRLVAIAVQGALLALAGGAIAQEFCVTCTAPDASYRCLIGGEAPASARSARGQFLCITELAKSGGHASCSATRGQTTPCPGPTRTVMFPPGEAGPPPLAEETAPLPPASPPLFTPAPSTQTFAPTAAPPRPPPGEPPPAVAQDAQPPQPPPEKPSVVEDLANKTGQAMNDTGKAVGNAVKKSWDCVTSLFGNC
jgi:hypothetical protein